MLVEKSFTDLEDAIYFLDIELNNALFETKLDDLLEAGIRWIPGTRRWQTYLRTQDDYEVS